MMKKTLTPQTALQRLEDLCARSEQASGELMQKLYRWGLSREDSEKILASLAERRFVDDRRFAGAYVRDKMLFSKWGRAKIAKGLMEKRVPRQIIEEALANADMEVYASNLAHILRSKMTSRPDLAESYEGRTKLYRFALSRGYEPALVSAALKKLLSEKAE